MNIVFEYNSDVSASSRLENHTKEKLEFLENKYDFIDRADVFFKLEKNTEHDGYVSSIRLSVPGPRLFASSGGDSYVNSINQCIRELSVQLEKKKSKMATH